jgi:ABC-type lipoprotein export system ATPase subunit
MWQLVRNKNKTFVVVTHNRDLAARADQTIELFDGQINK